MNQLHPYGAQTLPWRRMRDALRQLADSAGEADLADGVAFVWLVCLANTGVLRGIAVGVVFRCTASVRTNRMAILVHTTSGECRLDPQARTSKLAVSPPPPLHNP